MACSRQNAIFKFVLAVLFLLGGTGVAQASNWYVLKGATGSNNGTNWTNAWNEWNQINFSSVSCGDTIWVGSNGTAFTSDFALSKTCTAGSPLLIRRVLATDSVPKSAVGWNSSFASQVLTNGGSITLTGSYNTLDGRVGDAATSVAYGMQWNYTTSSGVTAVSNTTSTINNITFSHI